jgi:DNA polymerase eta
MNDSNGSLIAVNYLARAAGVKRNHRGNDARALCPNLQLVQVPTKHGKADLTLYRNTGKQVLKVLGEGNAVKVERASIDECYLDLTEEANKRLAASGGYPSLPVRPQQVHLYTTSDCTDVELETWWSREAHLWGPGERLIAAGAAIVAELREKVENKLGYTCSAGIAPTRLLAKLCSGLHKPAQQTVLPASSVSALLSPLHLKILKGLGGQFGKQVASDLKIETVGELAAFPLNKLENVFGEKDGRWLYSLARGIDDTEVEERRLAKSISCGKTFRGAYALKDIESVHTWLLELAAELEERVLEDKEDNQRAPQLLTVSIGAGNETWGSGGGNHHVSRSCSMRRVETAVMAEDAVGLVKRWINEQNEQQWRITDLFLAASNFLDLTGTTEITQFFKPASAATSPVAGKTTSPSKATTSSPLRAVEESERRGEGVVEGRGGGVSGGKQPFVAKRIAPSVAREGENNTIDEAVFAELPLEIQRELRNQMKFDQMQARARNGGGGGGSKNSKISKRPADTSQQTLKDLFHEKRTKK